MSTATPLVFRPSVTQRTLAALLCAGSWLVGVRALVLLIQLIPRLHAALWLARTTGESPWMIYLALAAAISACVVGGILLLLAVLALLLIEGCQVLVDDLGIAVVLGGLPGGLARKLGAGRLGWKQVSSLEKGRFTFVIKGAGDPTGQPGPAPTLHFLVVDELERLVLLILERSPNLRFTE